MASDGCDDGRDVPYERAEQLVPAAMKIIQAGDGSYGDELMKMKSCNQLCKDEERHCCLNSSHLNFSHALELQNQNSYAFHEYQSTESLEVEDQH